MVRMKLAVVGPSEEISRMGHIDRERLENGNCTETGVSSGFCYTQKMIAQPSHIDSGRALELARQVIETEASAVCALAQRLGQNFVDAVELLLGCVGKAVVSGIGKSGHIA